MGLTLNVLGLCVRYRTGAECTLFFPCCQGSQPGRAGDNGVSGAIHPSVAPEGPSRSGHRACISFPATPGNVGRTRLTADVGRPGEIGTIDHKNLSAIAPADPAPIVLVIVNDWQLRAILPVSIFDFLLTIDR
jgi:hypothetical protein